MATLFPDNLIFFEILTRLPAKSLMRFKCVSKIWKTLISGDPYFINAHRKQHNSEDNPLAIILYNEYIDNGRDEERCTEDEELEYNEDDEPGPLTGRVLSEQCSNASEVDLSHLVRDYGPIRFTSSCEGLICLTSKEFLPERVMLWNPATQQRRELPRLSNGSVRGCAGIGLDDVSGDWKVVSICFDDFTMERPTESLVHAHVFAKNGTAWRDCGASGIKGIVFDEGEPVAAAGALHWKLSIGQTINEDILSFDFNKEVLRFSNGPDCEYFNICKWRSSLTAFTYYNEGGIRRPGHLTVALPSSSGGGVSWSKLFKFTEIEYEASRSVWSEFFLVHHFNPFTLCWWTPKPPVR